MKKKDALYICTKRSTSFDTEVLFPFEGMEDIHTTDQSQSSEESSDTDGMKNCHTFNSINSFRSSLR